MLVLVLGCGPSGLIAAHAAVRDFDAEVLILSLPKKSELFGCQYLHELIPGVPLNENPREVLYTLRGSDEEYQRKVYGSVIPPSLSPQLYAGNHLAYDIRQQYNWLWQEYLKDITSCRLNANTLSWALNEIKPDAVISSIPATEICHKQGFHNFLSVPIWAIGDSDKQKTPSIYQQMPSSISCDGTEDVAWYRISNVFDYTTVEWPGYLSRPPIEGVVRVDKPLSTDCDCWEHSLLRVGRYGRWTKGVLAHETYDQVVKYLEQKR